MTPEQLIAAMRERARRAPTSEADRLLRMAAELERTPEQNAFAEQQRRPKRKVLFVSGGRRIGLNPSRYTGGFSTSR